MRQNSLVAILILVCITLSAQDLPASGWSTAFRDWSEAGNHFLASPGKVESASGILSRTKSSLEQDIFQKLPNQSLQKRLILFGQSPIPVGGVSVRLTQGLNGGAYIGKGRFGLMAEACLAGFWLVAGTEHITGRADGADGFRINTSLKRRVQLRGPLWSYATVAARWRPDPSRMLKLENGVSLAAGLEWHFGGADGLVKSHNGNQLLNRIRNRYKGFPR